MTEDDRIADVCTRADEDPFTLSMLTREERSAYMAGCAERGWLRLALCVMSLVIGLCIGFLSTP